MRRKEIIKRYITEDKESSQGKAKDQTQEKTTQALNPWRSMQDTPLTMPLAETHKDDKKIILSQRRLAEEEIFMKLAPAFNTKFEPDKVYRFKIALYGLKQSPMAQFGRFTKAMLEMGYKQSQSDHTLSINYSGGEKETTLLVYVDDIIMIGNVDKNCFRVK